MVHVTVKFVDIAVENLGGRISTQVASLASLVDTIVPINLLEQLVQQVDYLTVGSENDYFFILVGVQKFQQIDEPVLSWDLHVKLLNLLWN